MNNLLMKVVDTNLLDQEEEREDLTVDVESQINLFKYISPPSIPNPTKEGFQNDAVNILGVIQNLRVLLDYLKTLAVPCKWIDMMDILVDK